LEECSFESNKRLSVLIWCLECYHYQCMKLLVDFNCQAMWVLHFVYGTIDDELEILDGHMAFRGIGCVAPFPWFLKTFTIASAHNILALMLNPRFKWLKCVIDFFGHEKVKLVVIKYDMKLWSNPCLWNVVISWLCMM